ncbi:aminoglycoside N(3)-acetyltransferase [Streptomyces sp. NPDC048111]|uniref:aminoglycoside N(3)-acetyltransferase n=1 Tax=Streptomyces sp. NPDC048111 TaxID=3365500 RepID=UPI0037155492
MTSSIPSTGLGRAQLEDGLRELGVRAGSVLIVHASLSAFGPVQGGADAVVGALLDCLTPSGTLVVPTFTPEVSDPHAHVEQPSSDKVMAARDEVPLFHDALPTSMGAVPTAVLARPDRLRGTHPQASVAAIGPAARRITRQQPLAYALGTGSPFDVLHELDADILLLGVGHNRNSFLHYAESRVPHHRRKLRRFPYLVDGQRLWVEARDVGDDNGTHFPRIGAEFAATGQDRTRTIGRAECRLMNSRALVPFAEQRLGELLSAGA